MEKYYYKNGNCFLIENEPLNDLGEYEQITKKQYENYQKQIKEQIESHQLSELETKRMRIFELKSLLKESDYQAIKYAEGWLTEEEYAPIKAQRQVYRDEINQLEQEIEDAQ